MTTQSIQWPELKLPPINLWSAPPTKAMCHARQETLQESLKRLGYDSYWVRSGQSMQFMLRVKKLNEPGDFALMSVLDAVKLVEEKEGE